MLECYKWQVHSALWYRWISLQLGALQQPSSWDPSLTHVERILSNDGKEWNRTLLEQHFDEALATCHPKHHAPSIVSLMKEASLFGFQPWTEIIVPRVANLLSCYQQLFSSLALFPPPSLNIQALQQVLPRVKLFM